MTNFPKDHNALYVRICVCVCVCAWSHTNFRFDCKAAE